MTDWTRYDVPALASFLTEDDTVSWHQVIAWQHTYELLSEQRVRLASARAGLAEAWPPEKSEAASTFISFVDELTASMNETSEIALTNRAALAGVLSALAEARQVIGDLHTTWQKYAEMDRVAASLRVHMSPSAAPPNWSETLNAQAYSKMVETDQVIFENSQRMLAPSVFQIDVMHYTIEPIPSTKPSPTRLRLIGAPLVNKRHFRGEESNNTNTVTSVAPTPDSSPLTQVPDLPKSVDDGSELRIPAVLLDAASALGLPIISRVAHSIIKKGAGVIEPIHRGDDLTAGRESAPIGGVLGSNAAPSDTERRPKQRGISKKTAWSIPEGVTAIILPSQEPNCHDPGPGVIGIDR